MTEWWESLSDLQRWFMYAAGPFSLVLIIQTILTFVGLGDHDADTGGADGPDEAPPDISGFRFFTIRGIVAFFCIFGWTGYVLTSTPLSTVLILLISTAAGLLAMLLIGLMFYSIRRMEVSGNLQYSNAIGKEAEVYLPIPAQRAGKGKVMVTVQQRLIEADAITEEDQKLMTGEMVYISGHIGNTLIVNKQRS